MFVWENWAPGHPGILMDSMNHWSATKECERGQGLKSTDWLLQQRQMEVQSFSMKQTQERSFLLILAWPVSILGGPWNKSCHKPQFLADSKRKWRKQGWTELPCVLHKLSGLVYRRKENWDDQNPHLSQATPKKIDTCGIWHKLKIKVLGLGQETKVHYPTYPKSFCNEKFEAEIIKVVQGQSVY